MTLLSINAVSGGYAGGRVIQNVSFNLDENEVVGICGRNGVGKTTLIKIISGEIDLLEGSIKIALSDNSQTDISKNTVFNRCAYGISTMPQEYNIFSSLSVQDNLTLTDKVNLDALKELKNLFPILEKRAYVNAGVLSGGEKKLLSFNRVFSENNRISLLDEPTEGVAQENIDKMIDVISDYKTKGSSFIICEQNIDFLIKVADKIIILDRGRIEYTFTKEDFIYENIVKHIHV